MVFFHLAFILVGVVTTLLGPLLPLISHAWGLNDAQLGAMLGTQFLAVAGGGLASTSIAGRVGGRRSLSGAFMVVAVGLGLFLTGRTPVVLVAPALWGLGLGLMVPQMNLLVALTGGASALSFFNVMWSVGALLWSLTVFVAAHDVGPRLLIAAVLVLAAATAAGFAAGLGPEGPPRPDAAASRTTAARRDWRPAVVLPAILFLYGGVENSVGGWVASYVARFGGDRALALGAIAPAAFYAALALGRLGTTWLVRAFEDVTLLRAGWTCALLAIGAMLFLHDATQVIVAAFVAGLGCSVVYPITAATIAREVGPLAPRLVGPLLTTGGLGSGVIPWVVGQVSNRTGSLRAALFVAVLGGMVLLSLTFVRVSPRDAGRAAR